MHSSIRRRFLHRQIRDMQDQREVKRAVDALLRRGHTYQAIRKCLSALGSDDFLEDA